MLLCFYSAVIQGFYSAFFPSTTFPKRSTFLPCKSPYNAPLHVYCICKQACITNHGCSDYGSYITGKPLRFSKRTASEYSFKTASSLRNLLSKGEVMLTNEGLQLLVIHICPEAKWASAVWASEQCAKHMQSTPLYNKQHWREGSWTAMAVLLCFLAFVLYYMRCLVFEAQDCLPFFFFPFPKRSLRSSWRALRPWGSSAMRSVTTRPSRTKRMETEQTASWGKDRSRYDMTSPSSYQQIPMTQYWQQAQSIKSTSTKILHDLEKVINLIKMVKRNQRKVTFHWGQGRITLKRAKIPFLCLYLSLDYHIFNVYSRILYQRDENCKVLTLIKYQNSAFIVLRGTLDRLPDLKHIPHL